jgi:hypothetical protein
VDIFAKTRRVAEALPGCRLCAIEVHALAHVAVGQECGMGVKLGREIVLKSPATKDDKPRQKLQQLASRFMTS